MPVQEQFRAENYADMRASQFEKFYNETHENPKASKNETFEGNPVFKPHTFIEMLAMPPKKWLIDQVFGAGDIGMIYGTSGCGKTFLIIDMIMSLCTGSRWAKRFDVQRPLYVAYCAGEGIGGLPSRFTAIAKHYGITDLNNFVFYPTPPQLYDDNATATINHFCNEWKARQLAKKVAPLDVLIIDTLHTATIAADENSAQHMGKVLHSCRLAANDLGCAVVVVHHTNKSGSIERGSSALRGAMDFMIKIEKPSDTARCAVMSCEKLKDGERWKTQSFSLQSQFESKGVYVSWEDPDKETQTRGGAKASNKEELKTEMKRYPGKRFTCKSLSESIVQSPAYTRVLLKELEEAGECKRELLDQTKQSSNKNPWVYWINTVQEKAGVDV
jgi:hypothetical protein